jgi:hypothetical protein
MTVERCTFRSRTARRARRGAGFGLGLFAILIAASLAGCSHHITHIYIEESPGTEGLPLGADRIAIGIIQEVAKNYEFIFVSTNQSSSRVLAYYTKGSMDLRLFKDTVSQSLIFVVKDFDSWNPTPTAVKVIRDITRLSSERLPETTVVSTSQREHFPYGP